MFNNEKFQTFAFVFTSLTLMAVKGQMEHLKLENQDNTDITSDLTDDELKLALSDLSLKDLNTLQEFIDSADYGVYEYQDNSFTDTNDEASDNNDYDAQEFDNDIYFNKDQNGCNCNRQNNEVNDLIYLIQPKENFNKFTEENQRTKRNDQQTKINEEYIKQLAYSFPQNEQQNNNNHNVNELKTAHVRVKRN